MAFKKLKLWFDKDLAIMLSEKIKQVEPNFNQNQFVLNIDKKTKKLELKDRIEVIADELHDGLGKDFKQAIAILMDILGAENQEETGMFTEFYWLMPIAKYVEKYGLSNFEESMNALEEITKRNTSEYAIRPFIEEHFDKTMQQLAKWSKNKNSHVRRLSSEGPRPRLPWAKKLDVFIQDPTPILPILNHLKDDPSKYVQKSVANCINDILKDNYLVGKELLEDWKAEEIGKERKWIIKHALRNFIKANNSWAKDMVKP